MTCCIVLFTVKMTLSVRQVFALCNFKELPGAANHLKTSIYTWKTQVVSFFGINYLNMNPSNTQERHVRMFLDKSNW